MAYFLPRNIGCNRYPVYDIEGKFLYDRVREAFEFEDLDDLKLKLISLYGYRRVSDVEIDGKIVKAGLLIGWVKTYEEYVAILKERERDKEISQMRHNRVEDMTKYDVIGQTWQEMNTIKEEG